MNLTVTLHVPGVVVTDVRGTQWKVGNHIGTGGFGSIFMACEATRSERGAVPEDTRIAIKVEPHDNGSLFTEMHFYHRCAKIEKMEEWQRQRGLDYVGLPRLHGSGSFVHRRKKYRFIVIDRFGADLQMVLSLNDGKMPLKTALTVAIRVTDILEYIHCHGYVHKDIKAQNLLIGLGDPNEIFLVDFGLACRYFVNEFGYEVHKEFCEDPQRAHDGTIEFTSRDGHIGAPTRRSDLEVLLYNLLFWISGELPWSSNREDADRIAHQKDIYMRDPQTLMIACFGREGSPPYILEFATYVARLNFHEKPNYELCREMFKQAILKSDFRHDMQLQFKGGVHQVQEKRKNLRSYHMAQEKRLKVSLSGFSKGSVQTRLRRRGNVNETNGHNNNTDDDDDSSTSDRPSTVRRSCFDSRQSSGRRTGTHSEVEVKEGGGGIVITVDRETKESRMISVDELLSAKRACDAEREKQRRMAEIEVEREARKLSAEREATISRSTSVASKSKTTAKTVRRKPVASKRRIKRIVGQPSLRSRRVPLVEVSNSK